MEVLVLLIFGALGALGYACQAARLLYFLGWVRLLLGSLQRSFGRKSEIDSCGQIVLRGDVGRFDGAQRLRVVDLFALAFPTGCAIQVGGSLLQGVEHEGSALVIEIGRA